MYIFEKRLNWFSFAVEVKLVGRATRQYEALMHENTCLFIIIIIIIKPSPS